MTNAFQTLGLEPGLVIPDESIRDAFREKGKEVHPDGGGGEGEFAALQGAYELLSSPARRLKHWVELLGTAVDVRGTINSTMMDAFSEVGKITAQAEAVIRKRTDAKSTLVRAMLEGETQLARESVEAAISRLDRMIGEQCSVFPALEVNLDPDLAAETVRNLTFLEKWRAGLRTCFARLV